MKLNKKFYFGFGIFFLCYESKYGLNDLNFYLYENDLIVNMKYLLLSSVLLGLSTSIEAVTTRMFKVLMLLLYKGFERENCFCCNKVPQAQI